MPLRLQRYLAHAGVASRRISEDLIRSGRVAVNGTPVTVLGVQVDAGRDIVSLDGRVLKPRPHLYVAIHKPRGYLCTRKDPHGRRIVAELLPIEWRHLYPVGRLDRESEGLLFLTNDGEFCLRLTHPRFEVRKTYLATVGGWVDRGVVARLCQGIQDQEDRLRAHRARVRRADAATSDVELELSEGKYHEVRRLFASQGIEVLRLIRTRIGPIQLGELPPGRWRALTPAELKPLLGAA